MEIQHQPTNQHQNKRITNISIWTYLMCFRVEFFSVKWWVTSLSAVMLSIDMSVKKSRKIDTERMLLWYEMLDRPAAPDIVSIVSVLYVKTWAVAREVWCCKEHITTFRAKTELYINSSEKQPLMQYGAHNTANHPKGDKQNFCDNVIWC